MAPRSSRAPRPEGIRRRIFRQQRFQVRLRLLQGHIALAGGESAAALLRRAAAMAAETDVSPESRLGQVLRELRRAIEAAERGEHGRLFRGRLVENLSEGLRQWLARTGQLPERVPTSSEAIERPACSENSEP